MKKKALLIIVGLSLVLTSSSFAFAFAGEEASTEALTAAVAADESIATLDNTKAVISIKNIKPVLNAASSSYSKIKLTWDNVSGATGYKIYRATSKNGKYSLIKTIKGVSTTTYTDTKRTCGKTYYYKIRAYKTSGSKTTYSKYSAIQSTYARPNKVKGLEVNYTPTLDYFNLDWDKVSGASGYQIQVKPASTGKWSTYYREQLIDGTWDNFYPDEWNKKQERDNVKYITLGTEAHWSLSASEDSYEFRVRAYKTVNGKKVFGLYSEPVKIEPVWKSADELVDFVHTWVDENYPTYDREESHWLMSDSTPEHSSNWCTDWTYATISQYETKEYVLDKFLEGKLATYFSSTWGLDEETAGILYTRWLPENGWWQVWWLS